MVVLISLSTLFLPVKNAKVEIDLRGFLAFTLVDQSNDLK